MAKYIQGAAFYLFVYLLLGLINSVILYIFTKIFHVYPAITFAFLLFLSVFVLFFSFEKSVELFSGFKPSRKRLTAAWALQFFLFIFLATVVEKWLAGNLSNPRLFKILTVFVNFTLFFLTYWLSTKLIIFRGENEA